MTVYLLPEDPVFPPVADAEPDGLIAVGGDLTPERLLEAYASGIFPWYRYKKQIYWYSPDPRMVLFPREFKIADSLGRVMRSGRYKVKTDQRFEEVIRACAAAKRPDQPGSWISKSFIEAYIEMHRLGWAHSFETYEGDKLVGGLYGLSLGKAFFGESMFHKVSNASRLAFTALAIFAGHHGFRFIDCQTESDHLIRHGAKPIPRIQYLAMLDEVLCYPSLKGRWETRPI